MLAEWQSAPRNPGPANNPLGPWRKGPRPAGGARGLSVPRSGPQFQPQSSGFAGAAGKLLPAARPGATPGCGHVRDSLAPFRLPQGPDVWRAPGAVGGERSSGCIARPSAGCLCRAGGSGVPRRGGGRRDGVRGRWAAASVTSRGGASQLGRRSAEPRAQQRRPESPRGERNARGPMERYKGEDPSTHPDPGVVAVEGRGDPRRVGGHISAFVS